MTYWEKYVNIKNSQNSPIELDGIVCDGYLENKTVAVITHFHYDHIKDIEKMLTKYDKIIMTPITHQALIALNSTMRFRQQFVPTDYGTKYTTGDSVITLYDSNHIPGSCSVLVEHDGKRILYSGDFNYPYIHIPKCDYLVLDATHGDSNYNYDTIDRKDILQKMTSTVCEKIQNKEQVVITADRGTLQEIIRYFETDSENKIPYDVYFILKDKERRVLKALYKEDFDTIRKIYDRDSLDANKIIRENKSCVYFKTSSHPDNDFKKPFHVIIGRYQYKKENSGIKETENGIRCNLSTHANYQNILEFIRNVDPKFVLTDSSRSTCAESLADRIKNDLNIDATASKCKYS